MSTSKLPCHTQGTHNKTPHAPVLFSAQDILRGVDLPGVSTVEWALFSTTARWLEQSISRPHPELGRAGDVCPWTRRTLQLGRLFVTAITSLEPAHVDAKMLGLLEEFHAAAKVDGALDTFRAIVVVFPTLAASAGAAFTVATHQRLKPTFLKQRLMLGEFYPDCAKPGLHNPEFRPLCAPHCLLVIRAMVEPDLSFLTDEDAFVDAYLDAFGQRGYDNLRQLLRESSETMDAEHVRRLRRRFSLV